MHKILIATIAIIPLASCSTNEFDARIAEAEEAAYAASFKSAYKPIVLWKLDGEVRCTEEQKESDRCGITAYNTNVSRPLPKRSHSTSAENISAIGSVGSKILQAFTPLGLAIQTVKLVDSVGKNAGGNTSNTNSGNSSEANVSAITGDKDASMVSTETVSGIKSEGAVDQSQRSQTNPVTTDSSSIVNTDSNDSIVTTDSNDSTTTDAVTYAEPEVTLETDDNGIIK